MRTTRLGRGAIVALMLAAAPALAAPRVYPAPAQVIYPGEKIDDAMLADVSAANDAPFDAVVSRADLVGKVARRTLLPGQPISSFAVEAPRAVSVGAQVRLIYRQDGLNIATTAQALQNGYVGQVVQVRNLDSGQVVTGAVQPDGSVRVNGG